jgi:hypothetical protein
MSTVTRFQRASKKKSRLRMAICGPTGSGKTFTALRMAYAFKGADTKVAVINTESGAIEKYLGLAPDGIPFAFDILTLEEYPPTAYTEAIMEAGRLGYDVLVIDSLSHAWTGVGGALEIKDKSSGNSYTAWKDVTPMHNRMIEAVLRSPCHIITTMRSKMEYVLEERNGKMMPQRVGMAPVQRQGMEYEFDVVADMDLNHIITVGKTRCPEIDGVTTVKPGIGFMTPVVNWLNEGSDVDPSYYAVTDADLRALERKENSQLSNEGRLARARASQAAAVAAMQQQTASSTPDQPAAQEPKLCHPYLEEQIRKILPESGISVEALQQRFAEMGVSKIKELTQDQAEKLYSRLLLRKSEKMQADAATKLAASGTTSDVNCIPGAGKCDEVLDAEIRTLLPQAKIMPERFREMLAKFGAEKIRDLSKADATTLRDELRAKANGTPEPATETPPFDPGRSEAPGSVSAEQLDRIKSLVSRTGWPHERQVQWLQGRGCSSFRSISAAQADDLIDTLLAAELGFASSAKN